MMDLWRNISIVWLALLCFVALLPPIIILYLLVRGMGEVNRKIPRVLDKIRAQNHALYEKTEQVSTQVSQPVIRFQQRITHMEGAVESLFASKHVQEDIKPTLE